MSQTEQNRLPALLPRQLWHLALKLPALEVWMWAQREGWHGRGHLALWWSVQKRWSVQDVWLEYREKKKENSLWRDSVPTERARGDTSAHYRLLGRAILATAHNILGSGTLGVLRVGLLMDLLGVDGFNGWSKSAFIYFGFLAAAASGILCIFLAVTACLGYLDVELHLFPSWWTFFSEQLRQTPSAMLHFHL